MPEATGWSVGFRVVLLFVFFVTASASTLGAEGWLTEAEHDFFESFGVRAVINGRIWRANGGPELLAHAAQKAPPGLRSRIETFASVFSRAGYTEAEVNRLNQLLDPSRVDRILRSSLATGLIQAFFGRSEFDVARDVTNKVMDRGRIGEFWAIERNHIERVIAARNAQARCLSSIAAEAARRLDKKRPASDVALRFKVVGRPFGRNKRLCLEGAVGDAPVTQGVLLIDLYPESTNGTWVAMNVASGLASNAIGLEFGADAAQAGLALARSQERLMNMILSDVFLLPDLPPGAQFTISLEALPEAAVQIASLDAWLLSAEGTIVLKNVPGLEPIKASMRKRGVGG